VFEDYGESFEKGDSIAAYYVTKTNKNKNFSFLKFFLIKRISKKKQKL